MYGGHFPPLGHIEVVAPPPLTVFDGEGREIYLRAYGEGPVDDEYEVLVAMYREFDPAHRSLGVPPVRENAVREWLDVLLDGYCVLAWHGEAVVGQAALVEASSESYEMVVFVHPDYHGAGIGTRLVEALLSYGRERGVQHVWLLVDPENRPAMNLYGDVGFVVTDDDGYAVEMALAM